MAAWWNDVARGALLVAVASGCTFVANYDTEAENSEVTCGDGVDNDLDGRIDCEDSECWGVICDEDSSRESALCSDGIDNDLDGLPDDFDPACWSVARRTLNRCGSIRGSDASLADAPWAGGRFVEDATGERTLELISEASEIKSALLAFPLTGQREGTRIWARIRTDAAFFEVRLAPIESSQPIFHDIAVGVVDGALRLRLGPDEVTLPAPVDPRSEWIDLTLELTPDDAIVLSTAGDGSCDYVVDNGDCLNSSPDVCACMIADVPLGAAPTFELSLDVVDGWAEVGGLEVHRPPHHPCGQPAPPADIGPGVVHAMSVSEPELSTDVTGAADPARICVLFEPFDGAILALSGEYATDAFVLVTPPPGPSFPDRLPWEPTHELGPGVRLIDPVIDWDPATESFRGAAVVERDGLITGEVVLVESPDCRTWTVLGEPVREHLFAFAGQPGGVVGFDVAWGTDPPRSLYRLFTIRAGPFPDGVRDVEAESWSSPTGDVGSFVARPEGNIVGVSEVGRHPRYFVSYLERHRLRLRPFTAGRPGALETVGEGGTRLILDPSGVRGTFDSLWIEQGLLWMPRPTPGASWWGLFAYTARGCAGCPPQLGFAHFQPAGTQPYPH